MDGPKVVKCREEALFHKLIDIAIYTSFMVVIKPAWKNLEFEESIEGILSNYYDTPARREDYIVVTKSKRFPFVFCSMR